MIFEYNNAWYTFGGTLAWKNVTSKSYTPFGEQIGEAVSGFGYNGEYYNAATGMVYLRARFYEPEMNRFSQKDILWGDIISGTSLNRYLYCQNDPVNYADGNGQRMVAVALTDSGGGKYSGSVVQEGQIAEATRLVNEAKQYARNAKAAWQEAQSKAPGSQIAKDAMAQWKSAKAAASRASSNLTLLKKATNSFAAKQYLKNIRTARNSASQAANAALTLADRAGRGGAKRLTRTNTLQPNSNASNTEPGGFSGRAGKIDDPVSVHSVFSAQTNCTASPLEQGVTQFRDYLIEARTEKHDGTLVIGIDLSAGFGAGLGINFGIGMDYNGNVGLIGGYTAGAAMPSASAVVYLSISNASKLDALGGESIVVGASGGEGAIVGGEVALFSDQERTGTNKVAVAGTVQAGAGLNIPVPVEIHGMYADSGVVSVNLYDILIYLCDFILQ